MDAGNFHPSKQMNHTHEGSIGNLCNDQIVIEFNSAIETILKKQNL